MRERPILFSDPMVRAILEGRKTQTRRVVGLDTLQVSTTPGYDWTFRGQAPIRSIAQQRRHPAGCWQDLRGAELLALCPYGAPGDLLWVRETWNEFWAEELTEGRYSQTGQAGSPARLPERMRVAYRADGDLAHAEHGRARWRPSIHMPRWASRLTLRVTSVRVERLRAITEEDARAEGAAADDISRVGVPCHSARQNFERLWDSLAAEGSQRSDDQWVWCVGFERTLPDEGERSEG
jgi:hypothetical protein